MEKHRPYVEIVEVDGIYLGNVAGVSNFVDHKLGLSNGLPAKMIQAEVKIEEGDLQILLFSISNQIRHKGLFAGLCEGVFGDSQKYNLKKNIASFEDKQITIVGAGKFDFQHDTLVAYSRSTGFDFGPSKDHLESISKLYGLGYKIRCD